MSEKRTRYRIGWRGRLILQIEDATVVARLPPHGGGPKPIEHEVRRWRDATIFDLQDHVRFSPRDTSGFRRATEHEAMQ